MATLHTNNTASHNRLILEWLEHGFPIDQATALDQFGCFRLGARIYDLKKPPFERVIRTEMVNFVNSKTGNKGRFARYRLETTEP